MSPVDAGDGMADCAHLGLAPLVIHLAYSGASTLLVPSFTVCVLMVLGIFASSPPGEVTPHSARKVQKMPANGISSELRAHQMGRMSEVPGRPRTKNPRRSLMKFWTLQNFTIPLAHSSPPAGFVAQAVRSLQAAFGLLFLRLVLGIGNVTLV